MHRRRRAVLLAALVGLTVVASLFPFRIDPPRRQSNQVTRVDGALVFVDGVAEVPAVTGSEVVEALAAGPVAVRVEVESAGPQGGPARILTLSESVGAIDLMIGQQERDLIVRLRRAGSAADGRPAAVVPDVLDRGVHRIDVRLTDEGMAVSVDGRRRATVDGPVGPAGGWSTSHRLLLGNEHGGTRPWQGRLRAASLTTGTGTVDLVAASVLPEVLWVRPDRWLGQTPWYVPVHPTASQLVQAVAFAAIGFLARRLSAERGRAPVLLGCVLFSLVMLGLKFLVAGRHPSLADTVVQVVAAALGLWVAEATPRTSRS